MKLRSTVAALAAVGALAVVSACGGGGDSPGAAVKGATQPTHSHSPGMDMSGMDMSASATGPSPAAKMICAQETRKNVVRILSLSTIPTPADDWADGSYSCTYDLPGGTLALSVQDSKDEATGHKYFEALRDRTKGAKPFKGMEALGLPSFHNEGTAVFLKDGKTLVVDATGLPASAGVDDTSRTDVAYAVAAGVVACWSE